MNHDQSVSGNTSILMLLIILAAIIWGAAMLINEFNAKDLKLEEARKRHQEEILQKKKIIDEISARLERSWGQDLVARLHIKSLDKSDPQLPKMRAVFVQYERGNEKITTTRAEFDILGDTFHLDSWIINFDRANVENGDALRGKSLFTFRRVYGNKQAPDEGVSLHKPDWIPPEFKVADHPKYEAFERALWEKFWVLASDQHASREQGVDSAYGSGVFMKAQEGQDYKITISNDGKMTIRPERDPALLGEP